MQINIIPKTEKRKYRRLDSILPIEFQILNQDLYPKSGWYQAFSQDISKGGLCLTINNLTPQEFSGLDSEKSNLLLQIHSPISNRSFLAYAKVVWIKKVQELPISQYLIGISFTKVQIGHINRILRYVLFKKIIWHTLQFMIVGMLLILGLVMTKNFKLQAQNLELLNKYSFLLDRESGLNHKYQLLLDEKERLNKLLNNSKLEMEILQETMRKEEDSKNKEIEILEKNLAESKEIKIESDLKAAQVGKLRADLEKLKKTKDEEIDKLQKDIVSLEDKEKGLKDNLSEIMAKESEVIEAFSSNREEKLFLSDKLKSQLYNWLKTHQNQRTGLIVSFEGDYNLKDISFTYDQSLAVITYILFGDYQNAKKGLDFFLYKAEKADGGNFYNAYYSNRGEVAEYTAHAGPNLWLGIAILQFTNKTKDNRYINLAKQIAQWVEGLQDKEGGIIGGKNISWYSTEHNLDAFAFFNMFYELTRDEKYKQIADKILSWLTKYAYSNGEVPINRGKSDATIATDTYAWSIATLGPGRLKNMGMDPDKILEFAIENCLVATEFTDRFKKNINVSGFDFAKHLHLARGGVISCEWTAQMILSFNIMSDYYLTQAQPKEASHYQSLSAKYLSELSKMIISSPSAFGQGDYCLPYASQENVDTGHGWRTPKGNRTGSVAATAYTIFAISKFNPLQFESFQ